MRLAGRRQTFQGCWKLQEIDCFYQYHYWAIKLQSKRSLLPDLIPEEIFAEDYFQVYFINEIKF